MTASPRWRLGPLLLLLLLLGLGALAGVASPVRAQEAGPSPDELEAALVAAGWGELLRVRLRTGNALEGEFAGFRGGALLLTGGRDTAAVPAGDVSGVWLRRRQIRRGATIGGLIGGGVGLAFGVVVAALPLEGGQEQTDSDASVILTTTALGAGSGAALGGIVGASARRWWQLYPTDSGVRPPMPALVSQVGEGAAPSRAGGPAAPARRRFGSLDGAATYGRLNSWGGSEGGAGARVALLAEFRRGREGGLRPLLALGPEVEVQSVGTSAEQVRVYPRQDCTGPGGGCQVVGQDTARFTAGFTAAAARLVGRLGLETDRVRPYVLVGAGVHAWRAEPKSVSGTLLVGPDDWWTHPAAVAGAGLQVRPGAGPLSVGIEGRQNFIVLSGDDYPGRYWSVAVTVNTSL